VTTAETRGVFIVFNIEQVIALEKSFLLVKVANLQYLSSYTCLEEECDS